MAKNRNLSAAKMARQDEFYTQWSDIEREMNAYLEYDPDIFRDKTILLPCDDPEWSNFTKFFALHFVEYGLKKLISTSFAPNSNAGGSFYTPTLFEMNADGYDSTKSRERGRVFTLTAEDINGDGHVDIDDLRWEYLEGDGDFRSDEVTALRDKADIVITNPPFSLLREFIAWLFSGNCKFSIVGTSNLITYKDAFPLIKANRMWKGATANETDMVFAVPETVQVAEKDRLKAEKMGYKGNYTRMGNFNWFTNIDHGRRHQSLELMTEADNIRYSRHKQVKGKSYIKYHNYDAIEVPFVAAIPSDYPGVMGVPISFLDKYDPDQFEILGLTIGSLFDGNPLGQEWMTSYRGQGGTGHFSAGMIGVCFWDHDGQAKLPYGRILIRHRNPAPKEA